MEFVKMIISESKNSYSYDFASDLRMNILQRFLANDVRYNPSSFKDWVLSNESEYACGNMTALEREDGYVLLTDLYSEEKEPTVLKMRDDQFIQILTDWEEKVCKLRPKEVIIKYENDQFTIETRDQ